MMKFLYLFFFFINFNSCYCNKNSDKEYDIFGYISFDTFPVYEFGNNIKIDDLRLLNEALYFKNYTPVYYKNINIYLNNYYDRINKFFYNNNIENLFILHQYIFREQIKNEIFNKIKNKCDETKNSILCMYYKLHEFPWLEKHELDMYYNITLKRCLNSHLYFCYLFSTHFYAKPEDIIKIQKLYSDKLSFLPFKEQIKNNSINFPKDKFAKKKYDHTLDIDSKDFLNLIFHNRFALENISIFYENFSNEEKEKLILFLNKTTNMDYYRKIAKTEEGYLDHIANVKTFLYNRYCYDDSNKLFHNGTYIIEIMLYEKKYGNDKIEIIPDIKYLCNSKYKNYMGYCFAFNNLLKQNEYNFDCESSIHNMDKPKYLNVPE